MTFECVNASLPECSGRVHPHEAGDTPIETRLILIEQDLADMRVTLDFIRETIVKADTTITTVAAEIMPTVNDIMKSPLVKMLGMKK